MNNIKEIIIILILSLHLFYSIYSFGHAWNNKSLNFETKVAYSMSLFITFGGVWPFYYSYEMQREKSNDRD